jgi:hypothetical protein
MSDSYKKTKNKKKSKKHVKKGPSDFLRKW